MAGPRSACRGTITVNNVRKESDERLVGLDQDFFLAGMGRGRDHDRAAPRHRHQPLELGGIGRRRGNVELEVTGHHDVAASQRREALAVELRLREAQFEAAEQRRDRAGDAAPARKRALRHPAVDQHHRQPPRRARQDQVRPQIGLDEQRQRGPPVIEKPRDVTRRVIRHVLMDDVGGKPLGDDRRRRHRPRGQEDAQIQRPQLFDQGRGRQHLADAGAVNPHQRSDWTDIGADAAAFADARRIFLAELQPPVDQRRRQRHHRGRQFPVDAQRHRQRISQGRPPGDRRRHRRAGSLRSDKSLPAGAVFPWSRHRRRAARRPHQCLPRRRARRVN